MKMAKVHSIQYNVISKALAAMHTTTIQPQRNLMKLSSMRRIAGLLMATAVVALVGCSRITTEPGTETVIVDNPYFIGHGGVRAETQKTGSSWYWFSTHGVHIMTAPAKYDEPLDHLATNDNNFINYASYLVLQWRDPANMVKKFGYQKWYENNLKEQYRTIVRDVTKKYPMNKIMTDPETLASIEKEITQQTRAHIEKTGMTVDLINVNMGKALPNASVITEMDNTAVNQQRIKSETQRKLSEDARLQAEKSRANADNAYREQMKLDAAQFVQLESIKRFSEACSQNKNCVIVQGGASVMVGK
jgi:regulator of protease activity HflC (stomatin/prohibitin superfamily)